MSIYTGQEWCPTSNKQCYPTRAAAQEALRRVQQRRRAQSKRTRTRKPGRNEVQAYDCDHCDYWHLASPNRKKS